MKAILELPPGLTLDRLQELINDRLRDVNAALVDVVESPSPAQVDLGTHKIVNVADPSDDLDAVNLRTLRRTKPAAAEENKSQTTLEPYAIFIFGRGTDGKHANIAVDDITNSKPATRSGGVTRWVAWADGSPAGSDIIIEITTQDPTKTDGPITVFGTNPKVVYPADSTSVETGAGMSASVIKGKTLLQAKVLQVGSTTPGQSVTVELY